MESLNLDYLHTFTIVLERGSFSAAAERLGITQPAVSQQIRQLERSVRTTSHARFRPGCTADWR